ncbi:hypothetical protein ACQPXH_19110 [Nocardia sp. CA-135953]|uniref:hypothetical protein n=1 Tax=Nocardia sp. CA-135953 TaxID=3239978 RepID=UPI003D970B98
MKSINAMTTITSHAVNLGINAEDAIVIFGIAVGHAKGKSVIVEFDGENERLIGRYERDEKGRVTVIPVEDGTAQDLETLLAQACEDVDENPSETDTSVGVWLPVESD